MSKINPIGRVKCIVNSCQYYMNGDHCTASSIEIKTPDGSNADNTDCATFELKS